MKKTGASRFEQSKKEFGKVDFEGVSHDTDAHALAPAAARAPAAAALITIANTL